MPQAMAVMLVLVSVGCSGGTTHSADGEPAARSDEEVARKPTAQELESALVCVEERVGHELPRPADADHAPMMTEAELEAHFECVVELHLEDAFISPAGMEGLATAEAIAARNRKERGCMADLGWSVQVDDDPAAPLEIAERPDSPDSEARLRRDLASCGVPDEVIEAGFGS